jgi:hypothetical protein
MGLRVRPILPELGLGRGTAREAGGGKPRHYPSYYHGELLATHRQRNLQLIVQLLKMRNRAGAPMLGRYGAAAEFWSEDWERMTQRIETASVTWRDEHAALDREELTALALPDERERIDQIIARKPAGRGVKKIPRDECHPVTQRENGGFARFLAGDSG